MQESKRVLALLDVQQDQQGLQTPDDLMSLKELCLKHCYDYDYLYKWSVIKGVIKTYFRGTWKLSESEVLAFCDSVAEKKLSKVRTSKGGK